MENINTQAMLRVGATLQQGKYRIEKYLSSGGFGNTYMAFNTQFEEMVAIKEFFMRGVTQRDANSTSVSVSNAENHTQFAEQLKKFKKEARRIRLLHNDHIIAVYDLFEENGTAYYVMDYVDGESLSERLKRKGQSLDEQEVRNYLPQILDALQTIHAQGIWHLDLKPGNIMVDSQGRIRIIDFGASKQMANSGGGATSTATAYTDGYAPREQMEQSIDKYGAWTDLYALGATIYNLLTNRKPPLPSDIDELGDKAFSFSPTTSQSIKDLVKTLMATNRKDRPQTDAGVMACVAAMPPINSEDSDVTIISSTKRTNHRSTAIKTHAARKSTATKTPSASKTTTRKPMVHWVAKMLAGEGKEMRIFLILAAIATVWIFALAWCSNHSSTEEVVDSTAVQQGIATTINGAPVLYYGPIDDHNNPHGDGEAKWRNGKSYYKGHFNHGEMDGECVLFIDPDGNEFKGTMANGSYQKGTMTMTTGEVYRGTMKNNAPLDGTLTDTNGREYTIINGVLQ